MEEEPLTDAPIGSGGHVGDPTDLAFLEHTSYYKGKKTRVEGGNSQCYGHRSNQQMVLGHSTNLLDMEYMLMNSHGEHVLRSITPKVFTLHSDPTDTTHVDLDEALHLAQTSLSLQLTLLHQCALAEDKVRLNVEDHEREKEILQVENRLLFHELHKHWG